MRLPIFGFTNSVDRTITRLTTVELQPHKDPAMNKQFLLRLEQQGRTTFQRVRDQRQAMMMAQVYASQTQHIAVLDASGRVVWQSSLRCRLA
jgi:hypothetical protein